MCIQTEAVMPLATENGEFKEIEKKKKNIASAKSKEMILIYDWVPLSSS